MIDLFWSLVCTFGTWQSWPHLLLWRSVMELMRAAAGFRDLAAVYHGRKQTVTWNENPLNCEWNSIVYVRVKDKYSSVQEKEACTTSTWQWMRYMSRVSASTLLVLFLTWTSSISPTCARRCQKTNMCPLATLSSLITILFRNQFFEQGKPSMLRTDQKSIAFLQGIFHTYSKPGSLVFDPCLRTVAAANSWMSENKDRKFDGSGKDSGCVCKLKPSIIYALRSQSRNLDSVVNERKCVCSDARTFFACWWQHWNNGLQVRGTLDQVLRYIIV